MGEIWHDYSSSSLNTHLLTDFDLWYNYPCNYFLHASHMKPLRKVQNSAARLIHRNITYYISTCMALSSTSVVNHDLIAKSHTTSLVTSASSYTVYKLCSLMYGVHNNRCPSYISDVVQSIKTASRVDVYGQLKQPTMFSRGCVPSLLSEVSLTRVRPRGNACPSQSAEHHPRQPSNDNSKHFYFVTLLS